MFEALMRNRGSEWPNGSSNHASCIGSLAASQRPWVSMRSADGSAARRPSRPNSQWRPIARLRVMVFSPRQRLNKKAANWEFAASFTRFPSRPFRGPHGELRDVVPISQAILAAVGRCQPLTCAVEDNSRKGLGTHKDSLRRNRRMTPRGSSSDRPDRT